MNGLRDSLELYIPHKLVLRLSLNFSNPFAERISGIGEWVSRVENLKSTRHLQGFSLGDPAGVGLNRLDFRSSCENDILLEDKLCCQ